jgi:hypothetical protein
MVELQRIKNKKKKKKKKKRKQKKGLTYRKLTVEEQELF